jgi:pimeloyl-ACP methyl ester carboxylesterase
MNRHATCVAPSDSIVSGAHVPITQTYVAQGLRLKYLDWGNPTAPLVILLHGGMEQSHAWDPVGAALCDRWHVIAPDLRGHGDSDWSPGGAYSVLDYTADLAGLLKLLGPHPVTLIGHSLGGNLALHFTALYPHIVQRLCSIEGLGLSPQARAKRDSASRAIQMRDWVEEVLVKDRAARRVFRSVAEAATRIMAHDPLIDSRTAEALAKFGIKQISGNEYQWKYDDRVRPGGAGDVAAMQPTDLWSTISCPTLLLYGASSWASNPSIDGRARHFKNAQVVLVDGAGHNLHHHRPRAFLEIVLPFIEGVAPHL